MPPAVIKTSKCIQGRKQIAGQAVDHQNWCAPLRPFVTWIFSLVVFHVYSSFPLRWWLWAQGASLFKQQLKTVPWDFLLWSQHVPCPFHRLSWLPKAKLSLLSAWLRRVRCHWAKQMCYRHTLAMWLPFWGEALFADVGGKARNLGRGCNKVGYMMCLCFSLHAWGALGCLLWCLHRFAASVAGHDISRWGPAKLQDYQPLKNKLKICQCWVQ